MANYGFKTSNESPLQHEMRKENATKWKPSLSSQQGREGCHFRTGLDPKSQSPREAHRGPDQNSPRERRPGEWAGAGLRESPLSTPAQGTTVAEQAVPATGARAWALGHGHLSAGERYPATSGVG